MTNHPIDSLEAARTLFGQGEFQKCAEILTAVLVNDPKNVDANLILGVICAKFAQHVPAEHYLRTVLESAPDQHEALVWLSISRKSQGFLDEAIQLSERAVEIDANAFAYNALGLCWLSKREPKKAIAAFQEVLKQDPESPAAYRNLGLALRQDEQSLEAVEAFRRAVDLDPNNLENWLQLCEQLFWVSRPAEAIEVAKAGLTVFPTSTHLVATLANAYAAVGRSDDAEKTYKKAIELNPSAGQEYAKWLVGQGRFQDAITCLTESVLLAPVQGVAYHYLAEARCYELNGEPWLAQATEVYNNPALKRTDHMFLDYALGMALDNKKDYEDAMRHFDKACEAAFRVHNAGRPFDPKALAKKIESRKEQFSAEKISSLRAHGSSSKTPILIVGMIRSGTTLLEQILSSHPQVKAAGELDFWTLESERVYDKWAKTADPTDLKRLAGDYLKVLEAGAGKAPHITDKMPLNFWHLGLIDCALPEAKILHIRRNPIDTCLSIYMTYYGAGPNFAYSQENIVAYYRAYLQMMDYWRTVIPADRLMELDYEELISSKEPVTRKVLEFLELPWDDACLHHENNPSPVNTPSRWQARQPIYSTSVERWRRYEPWLGPLLELKDVSC